MSRSPRSGRPPAATSLPVAILHLERGVRSRPSCGIPSPYASSRRPRMAWFINQSLLIILAAFLLGLLVGWLAWGSRRPAPPATDTTAATPLPTEPVRIGPDDLERIEGIGPKMAAALRAAGIHTFGQLAEVDDDTRRTAIEAAGLTFAPSLVTWGRQARLLADGDEAGFRELTERLVAGRDVETAAQAQPVGRAR
ncbi:hypothetical protein FXF53_20650 [Micromonospora sp. WP24]|nr:hypothetical protein FXF53_20650 [Micromonospora sp. WP24]